MLVSINECEWKIVTFSRKSTMTIFGNSIKYTQIVIGCAVVTKRIYLSTVRWDITRASGTWHFVKFTVWLSVKLTENGRRCHLNGRLFIVKWYRSIRGFAVSKWNMSCLAEFNADSEFKSQQSNATERKKLIVFSIISILKRPSQKCGANDNNERFPVFAGLKLEIDY